MLQEVKLDPEDDKDSKGKPKTSIGNIFRKPKFFRSTKGYDVANTNIVQVRTSVSYDVPPLDGVKIRSADESLSGEALLVTEADVKVEQDCIDKSDAAKLKRKTFTPNIDMFKRNPESSVKKTKTTPPLEKLLSNQEKKDLSTLNTLYTSIDPDIPHEDLTPEQKFIIRLKKTYDSDSDRTKLKPVALRSKDDLAISKPLLTSVISNPKLKQISNDPTVRDVENAGVKGDAVRNANQQEVVSFDVQDGPKSTFDEMYGSTITFRYYDIDDNRKTVGTFKHDDTIPKSRSLNDLYFLNDAMEFKRNSAENDSFVTRVTPASSLPSFVFSSEGDDVDASVGANSLVRTLRNSQNIYTNQNLNETLDELYKKIDPNVPENELSSEQKFVKNMKTSFDEMERKHVIAKERRSIKSSGPTKQSVMRSSKLAGDVDASDGKEGKPKKSLFEKFKSKITGSKPQIAPKDPTPSIDILPKPHDDEENFESIPENFLPSLEHLKSDRENSTESKDFVIVNNVNLRKPHNDVERNQKSSDVNAQNSSSHNVNVDVPPSPSFITFKFDTPITQSVENKSSTNDGNCNEIRNDTKLERDEVIHDESKHGTKEPYVPYEDRSVRISLRDDVERDSQNLSSQTKSESRIQLRNFQSGYMKHESGADDKENNILMKCNISGRGDDNLRDTSSDENVFSIESTLSEGKLQITESINIDIKNSSATAENSSKCDFNIETFNDENVDKDNGQCEMDELHTFTYQEETVQQEIVSHRNIESVECIDIEKQMSHNNDINDTSQKQTVIHETLLVAEGKIAMEMNGKDKDDDTNQFKTHTGICNQEENEHEIIQVNTQHQSTIVNHQSEIFDITKNPFHVDQVEPYEPDTLNTVTDRIEDCTTHEIEANVSIVSSNLMPKSLDTSADNSTFCHGGDYINETEDYGAPTDHNEFNKEVNSTNLHLLEDNVRSTSDAPYFESVSVSSPLQQEQTNDDNVLKEEFLDQIHDEEKNENIEKANIEQTIYKFDNTAITEENLEVILKENENEEIEMNNSINKQSADVENNNENVEEEVGKEYPVVDNNITNHSDQCAITTQVTNNFLLNHTDHVADVVIKTPDIQFKEVHDRDVLVDEKHMAHDINVDERNSGLMYVTPKNVLNVDVTSSETFSHLLEIDKNIQSESEDQSTNGLTESLKSTDDVENSDEALQKDMNLLRLNVITEEKPIQLICDSLTFLENERRVESSLNITKIDDENETSKTDNLMQSDTLSSFKETELDTKPPEVENLTMPEHNGNIESPPLDFKVGDEECEVLEVENKDSCKNKLSTITSFKETKDDGITADESQMCFDDYDFEATSSEKENYQNIEEAVNEIYLNHSLQNYVPIYEYLDDIEEASIEEDINVSNELTKRENQNMSKDNEGYLEGDDDPLREEIRKLTSTNVNDLLLTVRVSDSDTTECSSAGFDINDVDQTFGSEMYPKVNTLSRQSSTSSQGEDPFKNLKGKVNDEELIILRQLNKKYKCSRPNSDINEEDLKLIAAVGIRHEYHDQQNAAFEDLHLMSTVEEDVVLSTSDEQLKRDINDEQTFVLNYNGDDKKKIESVVDETVNDNQQFQDNHDDENLILIKDQEITYSDESQVKITQINDENLKLTETVEVLEAKQRNADEGVEVATRDEYSNEETIEDITYEGSVCVTLVEDTAKVDEDSSNIVKDEIVFETSNENKITKPSDILIENSSEISSHSLCNQFIENSNSNQTLESKTVLRNDVVDQTISSNETEILNSKLNSSFDDETILEDAEYVNVGKYLIEKKPSFITSGKPPKPTPRKTDKEDYSDNVVIKTSREDVSCEDNENENNSAASNTDDLVDYLNVLTRKTNTKLVHETNRTIFTKESVFVTSDTETDSVKITSDENTHVLHDIMDLKKVNDQQTSTRLDFVDSRDVEVNEHEAFAMKDVQRQLDEVQNIPVVDQNVSRKVSSLEILYDSESSGQASATSSGELDESYLNLFKNPQLVTYENLGNSDKKDVKYTFQHLKQHPIIYSNSKTSIKSEDVKKQNVSFLRKKFESTEKNVDLSKRASVDVLQKIKVHGYNLSSMESYKSLENVSSNLAEDEPETQKIALRSSTSSEIISHKVSKRNFADTRKFFESSSVGSSQVGAIRSSRSSFVESVDGENIQKKTLTDD